MFSLHQSDQQLHLVQTSGWIAIGVIYFVIGIIWYWGVANEFAVISGLIWWFIFRHFNQKNDPFKRQEDRRFHQ